MGHSDAPSSAGMIPAPIPHNEAERLAALRNLNILDTQPSETFDRVSRLAAALLNVPIVLVSLVDEDRQWFKSKVGLNASETSREVSFCAHAIYDNKPLNVADATRDPRFSGNPLVTGALHIRAYFGIPVYSEKGYAIGTLCAIDTQTREFDEEDARKLDDCVKILEQLIHAQELAKSADDVLRFAQEREQLFRDTFEQAAVGITHTALNGRLLRVNQRMCDMLGYSKEELHEISFIDLTHPEDIPKNVRLFEQMMAGEIASYRLEKRFRCKHGDYIWTEISVALKRSPRGDPDYMIAVIEDIAARKQVEQELTEMRDSLRSQVEEQTAKLRDSNDALQLHVKRVLESEREVRQTAHRFRSIANNIPALIGYWDHEMVCRFANEIHREWFGRDPLTIVGMRMSELLGEEEFAATEPYVQVALEGHAQRYEARRPGPDGKLRFLDARYIPDRVGGGPVVGFYVLVTDVTQSRVAQRELESANAKLLTDSVTDYLTDLSNRRVFSERSEDALTRFRRDKECYGLILLDLDNFKQINDVYGHAVGDEVLRAVGRLLKGQLRSHRDVAARLGGEEFAILCFGELDEELLRTSAERIRAQIGQEIIRAGDKIFRFTASFGLAVSDAADTDWKSIYARADAALYDAKAGGKDRVAFGKTTAFDQTGRFRAHRSARS